MTDEQIFNYLLIFKNGLVLWNWNKIKEDYPNTNMIMGDPEQTLIKLVAKGFLTRKEPVE